MTSEPEHTQPTIRTVGQYTLHSILGIGGMGEVYRATDPHGEVVAVKLIRDDLNERPEIRRRFVREARAAARLVHPHIARLTDFGSDSGQYFMVMELLTGDTLAEWRTTPPDGDTLLTVFDQVLSALAYAHARGVVHRDLKLDNVLLSFDEQQHPVAKLLDFGVAHFRDAKPQEYSMEHALVGTPAYMSPEQALKATDVSPASDIYAVGVMLFEVLSGALPFTGKSSAGTLMAHLRKPIPQLMLRPGYKVSGPLENILHEFLAKDPQRRFMFACDARSALRGCRVTGTGSAGGMPLPASATSSSVTTLAKDHGSHPVPPVLARPRVGLFALRQPPFAGRNEELIKLAAIADRVFDGNRGGVVLVEGEMGMGKSRLVQRFSEIQDEAGRMQVWTGEFSSVTQPDEGIREALRRGLGVTGMTAAEMEQKLSLSLRNSDMKDAAWEAQALVEYLRTDGVEPEQRLINTAYARYALVERAISRATRRRPVMLVLENLHQSNEVPLTFVEWLLAGTARSSPWLVVATYRPEQVPDTGALADAFERFKQRSATDRVSTIHVGPMGARDMRTLVQRAVPMAPAIADIIAMRASGVPAFAIELVRHLVDSDRLEDDADAVEPETLLNNLPEGLGALLQSRLDEAMASPNTDDHALDIWEQMAILGLRIPTSLGVEMLRVQRFDDPEALWDTAVHGGLLTNILIEPEPNLVRFENGLLRDALLERTSSAGRNAVYHRAAAEAKLRHYADAIDEHSAEIARHYREAGEPARAAQYYLRAAEHARVTHLHNLALDAYRAVDEIVESTGGHADELRVRSLLGQAEVHLEIADYEQASRAAMQARFIESLTGESSTPRATRILAEIAHRSGNVRQALALYNTALRQFDDLGELPGTAQAQYGLGQLALTDGRIFEAERHFRAVHEVASAIGDRRLEASALAALSETALATGLYEEARAYVDNARKLHEQVVDRHGAALCLLTLGRVIEALGDTAAAAEQFELAREELLAVGDSRRASIARMNLGAVYLQQQRIEEARYHLGEAEAALLEMGDMGTVSLCRLLVASLEAEEGLWAPATEAIRSALDRDKEERIDDPRFVDLLIDLAKQALFVGRAELARELLETATFKLQRMAAASALHDRVDEVAYLLDELGDDASGLESDSVIDLFDDDP